MLIPVSADLASPNSTTPVELPLDNLPQGIVMPTLIDDCDSLPSPGTEQDHGDFYSEVKSESAEMSPASRMAVAIRARKERVKSRELSTTDALLFEAMHLKRVATLYGHRFESSARLSVDEFKASYARGQRNFSMCDLGSIDLQKQTLAGSNFTQSKLQKADLRNANLSRCIFGRANLAQVSLQGANLEGAYFNNADLQEADLRSANLRQASLTSANLKGANLCGADLRGARITDAQLAMARTNWSTVLPSGKIGWMR